MPTQMDRFRAKMEAQYGTGRVTRQEVEVEYEVVSTGSITLDYALRTGGWALGRLYEIVGQPGVGKSTLVLNSMAQHQLAYPDQAVVYIDMEQTFDRKWAKANGLDLHPDKFLHLYPDHSEQVSDMVRQVLREAPVSCVTIDSIGGMESKAAFEKGAEESAMGKGAQVITRMVKHVATLTRENQATCLLVNQLRANLSGRGVGDISAGPKALAYATSAKVKLSRTDQRPVTRKINGQDEEISRQVRAKVERNKVAPQGRTATFWITNQIASGFTNLGIDRADEAKELGMVTGVISQRAGGYYTLPNGVEVRGKDKELPEYLREHPEVVEQIRTEALAKVAHEVTTETEIVMEDA